MTVGKYKLSLTNRILYYKAQGRNHGLLILCKQHHLHDDYERHLLKVHVENTSNYFYNHFIHNIILICSYYHYHFTFGI